MRTGKRYLSLFLALILCLTMLSAAAFAEDEAEPVEEPAEVLEEIAEEPAEAEAEEPPAEEAEEPEPAEEPLGDPEAQPLLDGDTVEVGDYQYTITDGNAVLTKYLGTDKEITVPTSMEYEGTKYRIRSIAAFAFAEQTELTSVVIPDGINTIGNCAFKNCTSLSSLTICGDIEDCNSNSIRTGEFNDGGWKYWDSIAAFYNAGTNAESLTVTFADGVTRIPGYLFGTAASKADGVYAHVTNVKIADTVQTIASHAFYKCYDLVSLEMGNGVTGIEDAAFQECSSLKTLTMSNALTGVGDFAFAYDTGLKTIQWGKNLTSIGSHAFDGDTALTVLEFPAKLVSIFSFAFQGCTGLNEIDLPASLLKVDYCAFKNCTMLEKITIRSNIGDCSSNSIRLGEFNDGGWKYWDSVAVFYNAGVNSDKLEVTFADGVTQVPAYLFATAAEKADGVFAHVTKVSFSDSVESIGAYAFYHCYDLREAVMGKALTTVGSNAFAQNTSLSEIRWGSNLTDIGDHAFAGDTALKELILPEKTANIFSYAFENCTGLTNVVCPASLLKIYECAFRNCTHLSSITFHGDVGDCNSNSLRTGEFNDGGWKYWDSIAVFYNAGVNADSLTVTFAEGVTRVPAYLFATAAAKSDGVYAHVTKVVLPGSLKSVGNGAFYNCYDLTDVYYPGKQDDWEANVIVEERNEAITDHLRFGDEELFSAPDRVPGDVNGNGEVGIEDVVLLRRYLAGAAVGIYRQNANVNGDKAVDIFDLIRLRRFLAGAEGVELQ